MKDLLDDYYSDSELCEQLGISARTSKRYRDQRTGPAVTHIKGQPYYRKESVRAWLMSREGKGRAA